MIFLELFFIFGIVKLLVKFDGIVFLFIFIVIVLLDFILLFILKVIL